DHFVVDPQQGPVGREPGQVDRWRFDQRLGVRRQLGIVAMRLERLAQMPARKRIADPVPVEVPTEIEISGLGGRNGPPLRGTGLLDPLPGLGGNLQPAGTGLWRLHRRGRLGLRFLPTRRRPAALRGGLPRSITGYLGMLYAGRRFARLEPA